MLFIKVAAFHFEGKAYAWWLFEPFSLKNANTSTYARFIKRVVERFDEEYYEIPSMESIKPNRTKILHGLEGSLNLAPFQKTIEGDGNLYDVFPREKSPLHEDLYSQGEDMEITLSKEYQDLRSTIDEETFSTMEERAEDDNAVMTRAHLGPHEEEYGVLTPRTKTIAIL